VPLLVPSESWALTIDGPTSEWTGVSYPGLTPDSSDDQQTGLDEADIVGDNNFAALYTQYDAGALPSTSDDVLAFRIRMGTEEPPSDYTHVALVGIDGDLDGSMDMYVALNNIGVVDAIQLYTVGTDSNTSPNTTDTVLVLSDQWDSTNYDWSAVSVVNCTECTAGDLDLDGDGNDYFLSFSVPFDDIVTVMALDGIGLTPSTEVSYVIGTSVQPNAYNQDLGGVDGMPADPDTTWSTMGAVSTPGGINPVPEPSTALLLSLGLCALAASRQRRSPF
jgi:hypothetical protein